MAEPAIWTPPAYRMGGKGAHAQRVMGLINDFRPKAIGVPFGGWLGEFDGCDHTRWQIVVADADPAIREVLEAAIAGELVTAIERARRKWIEMCPPYGTREENLDAFNRFRALYAAWPEHSQIVHEDICPAGWAVCMSASATSGIWRRNQKGIYNGSQGQHHVAWLLARMISREAAEASQRWAKACLRVRRDGFVLLERLAGYEGRARTTIILDPPFGVCANQVYMGSWAPSMAARMVALGRKAWESSPTQLIAFADLDQKAEWVAFGPPMKWARCKNSARRTGGATSKDYYMGYTEEVST